MTYTDKQIENAKRNYTRFVSFHNLSDYDVDTIGRLEAERRMEYHNNIITQILSGNKSVANEWKLFFLNEEVKADQKAEQSKAKLEANKAASTDILAPIKVAKKLVAFGQWLNTSGNPYRKEHFTKKYTTASVNAFLSL